MLSTNYAIFSQGSLSASQRLDWLSRNGDFVRVCAECMRVIVCVAFWSDDAKLRVLQEHSDGGCTALYIYTTQTVRGDKLISTYLFLVAVNGFPIDTATGPVKLNSERGVKFGPGAYPQGV